MTPEFSYSKNKVLIFLQVLTLLGTEEAAINTSLFQAIGMRLLYFKINLAHLQMNDSSELTHLGGKALAKLIMDAVDK